MSPSLGMEQFVFTTPICTVMMTSRHEVIALVGCFKAAILRVGVARMRLQPVLEGERFGSSSFV